MWDIVASYLVCNFKENYWVKLEKMTKNLVSSPIDVHLAAKFFLKNLASSVNRYHGQLSSCTISKKIMTRSWENLVTDRLTDRLTDGLTNGLTDEKTSNKHVMQHVQLCKLQQFQNNYFEEYFHVLLPEVAVHRRSVKKLFWTFGNFTRKHVWQIPIVVKLQAYFL